MSVWKGLALAVFLWLALASFLFGVAHLLSLIVWSIMLIYALISGHAFATLRTDNARRYWAQTGLIAALLVISIVQTVEWYDDGMPIAMGNRDA